MTKFNKLITLSSVALLASVSPQLTFADTTVPASTDVPAVVAPSSEPSTVPSSDTDVPAVSTAPSETTSEQETPSSVAPSDPSSNVPTTSSDPSSNVPTSSSDSNEVKPSLANGATTNPLTDATTNSSNNQDKDKNVDAPTNNPNVSAQTAADTGASQVGTTSQVTGQVVEEVTPQAPVQTNTGDSIVGTRNGNVVLSDGSVVAPEEVGGTLNEDKTISVTSHDGKLKTLPNTGEKESLMMTFAGIGLLATLLGYFFKKRSI
ncbi:LPXTG cell wall anchor domain-containing protein [Streptococcus sp. CF8-6]|uniref:LPXTG cell wall anchor domain-containing protein n=1 Tax=Streptococcus sp. CF8-6 TaxID=2963150 RepID=UPI0020C930C6|nr:LPXTG cell wall anchor domain-containing protein [Streptococcus sp. CF8-6]MCP9017088.1 LPXTG cell wall anchor domain-containing protein [Streptococcus sp. CF8-6]